MPVTKGTSARGEWQRQDVVFEMQDGAYARKICVTFFNRPDDVARLKEGAIRFAPRVCPSAWQR